MSELFLASAILFVLIAALAANRHWVAAAVCLGYLGVAAIGRESKCPTPAKPVIKQIVATDHAMVARAKMPESL